MKIKEIEQRLFLENNVTEQLINELRQDERVGVKKLLKKYETMKKQEEELRRSFHEKSKYENQLRSQGIEFIAGVDEVGRGPLAGPVVSAAVILPKNFYLPGLTDSKKLTKQKREQFYEQILNEAISIHVSFISAEKIDEINIYEATKRAMIAAINGLSVKPEHVLIDAMKLAIDIPQTSIIKGDDNSISIAASSVIAKVERDRYMVRLNEKYPQYGFDCHMGYGTKEHLEAIQTYGVINEHRKSFRPVKEALSIQCT